MKAKPSLYRGIEFISIEDLPLDQQNLLKSSFNKPELINILISGKGLLQCMLYSAYSDWHKATFGNLKKSTTNIISKQKRKEVSVVYKKK